MSHLVLAWRFLPFLFYPILGFGDAEYQPGPLGASACWVVERRPNKRLTLVGARVGRIASLACGLDQRLRRLAPASTSPAA